MGKCSSLCSLSTGIDLSSDYDSRDTNTDSCPEIRSRFNGKMSSNEPSNRSAQRWVPVSASISCPVMRPRPPALRTPDYMSKSPATRYPRAQTIDEMLRGYRVTQMLHVAAKLGIADHLKDGPLTATELARLVGADAGALTVERAQALLSTCEVPINVARGSAGDSMTLGSLVMELDLPALHYAPGPPAEDTYSVWTF